MKTAMKENSNATTKTAMQQSSQQSRDKTNNDENDMTYEDIVLHELASEVAVE